MKKLLLSILPVGIFVAPAYAAPFKYELDPAHTSVAFLVDHLGYAKTLGFFQDVSGSFVYDLETQVLSDVEITVKTASVESFNEARDNHVRNSDFLNVAEFPAMTFTADGGTPSTDTTGTVTGTLTLLGQSQPLELDVTLNKAFEYPFGHGRFTLGLSVRGTLLRSDFGMTYAVDNGFVGDNVDIIIETEAMRMN
ncbi:polyisoprenoid-binding protein YceI [Roseibium hamelinense]|uniref:Polyisoprenoid-binding protein YceI n=1 Tax=Roseibium hamelinense TaxID=150831 RepID=A0A562SNL8_9HYPH|nr:YceI family protein [Roseibium hamelinense]MTI44315.1 polyisoprenoid-binding protein [Roseibium hamelinense]TWI82909.1 polyisoprenoid-binding protein YceI [Roseibium hamelinense]